MYQYVWGVFVVALLVGCGDDAEPISEPDRYPPLATPAPFEWANVDVGVGIRSGEAMGIASFRPDVLPKITETFPHAVYRLQTYDQVAPEVGEYLAYPPPMSVTARGPIEFRSGNVRAGRLSARASDMREELSEFGANFGEVSVVVDFWRLRQDWYVRWDGQLEEASNNTGRGPYGFYRQDFFNSLLDEIESVATEQQPVYMVIGTEMERLLRTREGNGVAPSEFANFMGFFQSAVTRIKRASPNTKVGFGINWTTFVERVAPQYGSDNGDTLRALDVAFELTLLPLLEKSDFVALSVYGTPSQDGSGYQFLRRLEDLYGLNLPIVVYEFGSPVNSVVDYLQQKNFVETFESWMAGLPVEFVAWKTMTNLDGSDTANQVPTGRCETFRSAQRGLEMPVSGCYDGLVTSIFSEKEVFSFLRARLGLP